MLRVRKLRKEQKLTAKELAEKCGVKESTICYVETGKRKPSYELLLKLSDVFGCSLDYLVGHDWNTSYEGLTEEESKMIKLYSLASPAEQEMIMSFLRKYE